MKLPKDIIFCRPKYMEEVPVKYRKRKEMTPERLALLEKAREKAQLVIQEREK